MKKAGVYILKSLKNGYYYIGSSDNIERRFSQHNKGLVKATKNISPLELKCFILCGDLTEAKKSEYRLKSYKRKDILEKVIIDKTFPWNHRAHSSVVERHSDKMEVPSSILGVPTKLNIE